MMNAPTDQPRSRFLIPVGDHALLDHVGHGGADLLGMDAQVVTVHQFKANGVGDTTEAQLDAVAIVNHLGGVAGNSLLSLADGGDPAARTGVRSDSMITSAIATGRAQSPGRWGMRGLTS